jgi:hypothetical protein
MNLVAIFFVPAGVSSQEVVTALREHFEFLPPRETPPPARSDCRSAAPDEPMPLWTWFIPNPCH